MQRQRATLLTLALLVMFLTQLLPVSPLRAQEAPAIPAVQPSLVEPPFPEPVPVPELPTTTVTTPRPTLAVAVFTEPEIVRVGEWITVSVQIANRSLDPAEDLVVTLPLPDGVTAGPDAPQANSSGWEWKLGSLKGETHTMLTTRMRLNRMPRGEALVIEPAVQARWLDVPATGVGGALVDERALPTVRPDDAASLATPDADLTNTATPAPETDAAATTPEAEPDAATTTPEAEPDAATTTPEAETDAAVAPSPAPQPAPAPSASGESRFTPGAPATLRSPTGRVEVQFPPNAAKEALDLTFRFADEAEGSLRAEGKSIPPARPAGYAGFGTIHLDARDLQGRYVATFDAPVTIRMRYTPEQLRVLDILPGRLTLFWYDPDVEAVRSDGVIERGAWVPIETTVDHDAQTVSATVDHFSAFQLGNGLSPSSAFIPSLQGWQVSEFTGGAQYSFPLDVPAGPGGLKPNVVLSYSSNSDDGPGGSANKAQASWVGRGWSLEAGGSISRNKNTCCGNWDHFVLTAMGHSFDVVRGNHINGPGSDTTGNPNNLTEWNWHIVDEAYWRIQANTNNTWTAWAPDGTRYNFTVSLVWGWRGTPDWYETYKWLLTSVIDPSGNQITFEYATDPDTLYGTTINPTYRLLRIRWGRDGDPPGTGTSRYRLEFISNSRFSGQTEGVDAHWDYSGNQIGTNPFDPNAVDAGRGAPHEKYRLDAVEFFSYPSGTTAQEVTRWQFGYAQDTASVRSDGPEGQRMLTLTSIQRLGRNGNEWTPLPVTTFTYRTNRGTTSPNPPTAGWNRLHTVDNGQGGRITFTYGHVWSPAGYGGDALPSGEGYYHGSPYAYRFRVSQMLQEDIAGKPYSKASLHVYYYSGPALNTQDQSATVWYARYTPPGFTGDSRIYLARPEKGEFRGHSSVSRRVYDGSTTSASLIQRVQTWFYQGSNGCTPALLPAPSGGNQYIDETNSCFQEMVKREAWKGRAYRQDVLNDSGTALQRTETLYSYHPLPFYTSTTSNNYKRAGLWRAFTGQSRVTETLISGGNTSSTRTDYFYNGCGTGAPSAYGQATCVDVYDQQNTRVRRTEYAYAAPASTGLLLADRLIAMSIRDSSGAYLAHTQRFYDGNNTTLGAVGTLGRMTREIKVVNIGGLTSSSFVNVQLNGVDTTYIYDAWGNVTSTTTYAGPGWVKWNGSAWAASAPGNGSTSRTTTTTYHNLFRHLPISVQYPIAPGGTPLTESAAYDLRMGTITSITDFNNQTTTATYDEHGRLETIRKPGDGSGFATLEAAYYDAEQPFRYAIAQRDSSDDRRVTQLFYDGLGRQVQTKLESSSGTVWQNIVNDSVYDALGRVRQQSQARYVTNTSSSFYQYTNPGSTATMRWTTTSYDMLGRASRVDVYDPSDTSDSQRSTTYAYTLEEDGTGNWLNKQTITDDNGHQIQNLSDSLGRLRKIVEVQSSFSLTTRYIYNSLDLLIQVRDHAGNLTKMQYDSLGRKTRMEEPNMGGETNAWTYAYWGDGNLWRQSDARGQSICFYYDAMERPTAKHFVSGTTCATSKPTTPSVAYTYDQSTSSNGRGRLTSTNSSGTGTTWNYDARGRTIKAEHSIAGVTGTRTFEWGYHSNDLVRWIRYPSIEGGIEQLNYTYDAAWRQTSVCSATCYVTDATYTALNQPDTLALGNGVPQTWSYTERGLLSRLRVGSATPGQVFDRSYSYDGVGNITSILDNRDSARQTFRYDELDRLTSASAISSTVASGTTVTVRARGQDGGGWPTMKLRVNGTVVQTWTVNNANWANYTHTLTSAIGPTDLVDIVYDNNATSTGDRNLFVDYIQFGSATPIQAEARTVTYDRNATDGNDLWASDGLMLENGALRLTQKYGYSALGNLSHKEGATYGYGTQSTGCAAGALTKPHALVNGGGTGYCYDQNGNMVSGGGRTIAWNAENLPSSVTSGGVTESYTYNPDSARVKKVRNGITTIYLEGLYEEEIGGSGKTTRYYTLNGQTVAQRTRASGSTATTVTYLHGDHLGSVSATTNTSGVATLQEFDVWGLQRVTASQAIPTFVSTRNYTGQIRDETGLLFYNARYYDPRSASFLSADTVVPGSPSGTMNGVAVTPLTVDFHEGGFRSKLNSESKAPFWFQMDGDAKQQHGSPMGPANPQALNRYSYVQNNPLKYTDPTGHTVYLSQDAANQLASALNIAAAQIAVGGIITGGAAEIAHRIWAASGLSERSLTGTFFRAIATALAEAAVAGIAAGLLLGFGLSEFLAYELNRMAEHISAHTGADGIAIATDGKGIYYLNRTTGKAIYDSAGLSLMAHFLVAHLPEEMRLGGRPVEVGEQTKRWWEGRHFKADAHHYNES